MSKKYKIVTEKQIIKMFKKAYSHTVYHRELLSTGYIAKSLNTSKYQVSKILKKLNKEEKIEYTKEFYSDIDYETGIDESEITLPLWGYFLICPSLIKELNEEEDNKIKEYLEDVQNNKNK